MIWGYPYFWKHAYILCIEFLWFAIHNSVHHSLTSPERNTGFSSLEFAQRGFRNSGFSCCLAGEWFLYFSYWEGTVFWIINFFGQCQHFAQFVDWSKITRSIPKQVSFLTMGLCVEHPPRMISHECFYLVCYQQFPILRRFFWFRNLRQLPRKWLSFSREWEIQVENGTAVQYGIWVNFHGRTHSISEDHSPPKKRHKFFTPNRKKNGAIGIRIFLLPGRQLGPMAGRNPWGLVKNGRVWEPHFIPKWVFPKIVVPPNHPLW